MMDLAKNECGKQPNKSAFFPKLVETLKHEANLMEKQIEFIENKVSDIMPLCQNDGIKPPSSNCEASYTGYVMEQIDRITFLRCRLAEIAAHMEKIV
jgi:hypothetical protein